MLEIILLLDRAARLLQVAPTHPDEDIDKRLRDLEAQVWVCVTLMNTIIETSKETHHGE